MADDRSGKLVARWQAGDQAAATELFQRYANRLIALARSRLPPKLAARVDPEDVVQSVCRSFFADARDGRFDFQRSGDLWRLLVAITLQKVQHQVERQTAEKRSVNREHNFSSEDSLLGLQADALAREPSPVEAVVLMDELQAAMHGLEPLHRRMFELRLQGYNLFEIAAATSCCERTVRRVLQRIQAHLQQWYRENSAS